MWDRFKQLWFSGSDLMGKFLYWILIMSVVSLACEFFIAFINMKSGLPSEWIRLPTYTIAFIVFAPAVAGIVEQLPSG